MSTLFTAMTTKDVLTENGMPTNSTTGNHVLDLFYTMGSARKLPAETINRLFSLALNENEGLALKAMFYNRDIRGGQGERRSFRIMLNWLATNRPEIASRLTQHVFEYGRSDDLLGLLETTLVSQVSTEILDALRGGNALCAKWLPRDNKAGRKYAKYLRELWDMSPKQYRKLVVGLSRTVETQMCARNWVGINFNHIPSKASHTYRSALLRHDEVRFRAWLAELSKPVESRDPKVKINASAIFPSDVVKPYFRPSNGSNALIEAQWKALPNYQPEGRKVLAVCDVSGSMSGEPMEVCVALGIYTAERLTGPFKNGFVTFSGAPRLQILNGATLHEKVLQLVRADWGMNTNVEAVFNLILTSAKRSNLTEEDMPDTILIMSDMQFDQCVRNADNSVTEMYSRMYVEAGYKLPNVIFWNLRTSSGIPVKATQRGVAVVSGYSPSALQNILGGEIDPTRVMLKTLLSERYERIN